MTPSHAHDTLVTLRLPLAAELNQDKVTPGLLGFVIFAAIAVGLWLLMRNMGKQMKKINFEEHPADEPRGTTGQAPDRAADRA
ncbi:hypothetical protein [Streptomyces sp.]|uniref:hypothetical protein n=1 Tax=Streptomyces sp. TaxID=1931 RepID=UPI002F40D44D